MGIISVALSETLLYNTKSKGWTSKTEIGLSGLLLSGSSLPDFVPGAQINPKMNIGLSYESNLKNKESSLTASASISGLFKGKFFNNLSPSASFSWKHQDDGTNSFKISAGVSYGIETKQGLNSKSSFVLSKSIGKDDWETSFYSYFGNHSPVIDTGGLSNGGISLMQLWHSLFMGATKKSRDGEDDPTKRKLFL